MRRSTRLLAPPSAMLVASCQLLANALHTELWQRYVTIIMALFHVLTLGNVGFNSILHWRSHFVSLWLNCSCPDSCLVWSGSRVSTRVSRKHPDDRGEDQTQAVLPLLGAAGEVAEGSIWPTGSAGFARQVGGDLLRQWDGPVSEPTLDVSTLIFI